MSKDIERQLQTIADTVTTRHLREPAIFFLEMFKPLVGCARELSTFAEPAMLLVFGSEWCERLKVALTSSETVEQLICMLERADTSTSKPLTKRPL